MNLRTPLPLLLSLGLAASPLPSQAAQPRELGQVEFTRDFDAALGKTGEKPVFVQFQEVPG